MIVLDEEISNPAIASKIATWYPGRTISIKTLRPNTIIKDDSISALLHTASKPTLITINVTDFWHVIPVDPRYSIVCIDLPNTRSLEVPVLLRRLLKMTEFKTKAVRMGKVIRLRPTRVDYYDADGQLKTLAWPE